MTQTLQAAFLAVVNMSLTAGVVIGVVALARLALKRAPKIFSYALWGVVLFRLLCPVSLTASFSLMGAIDAPARVVGSPISSSVTYLRPEAAQTQPEGGETARAGEGEAPSGGQPDGAQALPQAPEQAGADRAAGLETALPWIWLAGALALLGYGLVSFLRLRRRLDEAIRLKGNLYLSDRIGTPFVLGLFRPRVYLPATLRRQELPYILAHEHHHICRGDHILRLLAFLALALHWFNPLVWAAFLLSGKDMEMSCDEAVVAKLGGGIRADYSASLLSLSTGRRLLSGLPLAFGEGETLGRVRNLLRWRRPRRWLTLLAAAACLAVAAACAANPMGAGGEGAQAPAGAYDSPEDYVAQALAQVDEVEYASADGGTAALTVEETRLDYLVRAAQVEGLAPEGTLETWQFSYQVRPDAAGLTQLAEAGIAGEGGWYTLGYQPEMAIVLRYPDGSCDVLRERTSLEGWGAWYENEGQALYDWYVQRYGLDVPRYVEDWADRLPGLEALGLDSFPMGLLEGDGWTIRVPLSSEVSYDLAQTPNGDGTLTGLTLWPGGTLSIQWTQAPLERQREELRNQGYAPADSTGMVWRYQTEDGMAGDIEVRFYPAQDGVWRVSGYFEPWQAEQAALSEQDGALAAQLELCARLIQAMAESFTVAED